MSEPVESMKQTIDELKAAVAKLTDERDTLKKTIADIDAKAFEAKIASHEATIKSKDEEIKTLTDKVTSAEAKVTESEKVIKETEEKAAASKAELDKILADQKLAKRSAMLKEKGLSDDQIEKVVSKFNLLTDDDFKAVIDNFASASAKPEDKKVEDKAKAESKDALDKAEETPDAALGVGGTNDAEQVEKDIAEFISANRKSKKAGE